MFSTWLNNQYAKLSGTSMATPVITGVVALIIGAADRELSPDDVYDELVKIAVDVDKPGKDEYTGNGIPVFTSQWEEDPATEAVKRECWLKRVIRWVVSLFSHKEA